MKVLAEIYNIELFGFTELANIESHKNFELKFCCTCILAQPGP